MTPNEWYRIVEARDVQDVPRLVLATNAAGEAFWILDARSTGDFDPDSPIYTLHDAGHRLEEALARFALHGADPASLPPFGCIPVAHVLFDETRREALKLTSPPIT